MKWNLLNTKCYTLILFSVYLCLPLFLASQNDNDNHRKYWYYRSPLVNDFMKVGLGQSEITIKKVVVQ